MENKEKIGKRQNPYYQAQAILSHRDQSVVEIKTKLKRKGFSTAQIEEVIDWLHQQKLVNDENFATKFIESLVSYKRVGPRWVQAKLREKGIEPSLIEKVLTTYFAEHPEEEVIQQAIHKWQRRHPRSKHDRERLVRFLISRGFSPNKVFETAEEVLSKENY